MKMKIKKVGILVPFYNQEKFVREALESYIGQTYYPLTIYALDDKSQDDTIEEIEMFEQAHLTVTDVNWRRMIHTKNPVNLGVFRSYNYLAELAMRDGCSYIIPVGGDDIMMPTCIEEAVKLMEKGKFDCVDLPVVQFGITEGVIMRPNEKATYQTAWQQNPFTSFMLYKSKIWKKYGGYDTRITPKGVNTGIEDIEFHLRLLRDQVKVGFLQEVLYKYRIHENNSHRQAAPHLDRLYKIIRTKHAYYE